MITFIRTAAIAPGKTMEALQFAKKVSEYIKSKHDGAPHVSTPVGGNPNRISWVSTYASLAEMEERSAKLLSDPEYLAMVASAASLFLPGTVHDEIWRSF
jgi:hypothetical protein